MTPKRTADVGERVERERVKFEKAFNEKWHGWFPLERGPDDDGYKTSWIDGAWCGWKLAKGLIP